MPQVVRCPRCGGLSRVADEVLGVTVACPTCDAEFVAQVLAQPVQTLPAPPSRAERNPTLPVVPTVRPRDAEPGDEVDDVPPRRPVSGAIGLALLPLGIPLAWLVAPLLGLGKPIFSFAAPVSLALGLLGLGLGIAYCYGWSVGARLRAVSAIVAAGYAIGLVLLLANAEWAVALRRNLPAPANGPLKTFVAPGKAYSVALPGVPEPAAVGPIPGWELVAFRAGPRDDRRDTFLQLVYESAHGNPPVGIRFDDAAEFYAATSAALAESTGGTVTADAPVEWKTRAGNYTFGDFTVTLPDGARRRAVRVVHDERRGGVFYLAVEGAFLPDDLREVREYFLSLSIPAK